MRNNNEDEFYYLAVYGTLKENFPNYYYYLNPKEPIFRGAVKLPFMMYEDKGLPILFPSEEINSIFLEIYEVNHNTLLKIDRLEGVPKLYSRESVFIEEFGKEVFIYVIVNRAPFGEAIKDGIFRL